MAGQELELWTEYIVLRSQVTPNSEDCLFWLVQWPLQIARPIEGLLEGHQVRIIFGSRDWMYDFNGKFYRGQVIFAEGCTHQMTFIGVQALLDVLGLPD
jgi:hypothetical protein